MKKIIFMVVASMTILFTSCNKDNTGLTPDKTETAIALDELVSTAARYAVAEDTITVKRCKGKLTEIDPATLSATITDYLTANYPGYVANFAATDAALNTVVVITQTDGSMAGSLFDATGTFIKSLKQHMPKAKLTEVELSALPATIIDYVATNYEGFTISKVGMNTEGEFIVGLTEDTSKKVLLFNADGSFNRELERSRMGHKGHKKGKK